MNISKSTLKSEVINLAVALLIRNNFKNSSFLTAYAGGKAANWVGHKYGGTILDWIGDSAEFMMIISKSKVRPNEALEDLQILRAKKARRLANKIISDH